VAIKDWLEPVSLTNEEQQELESLKSLVASRNFFFKTQADNVSEEWVNKGVEKHLQEPLTPPWFSAVQKDSYKMGARNGFKAGIQYAFKAQTEGE
jgi:hypothetical protein